MKRQNEAPEGTPAPPLSRAVLQRTRAGGGKWVVRVLLTPPPDLPQLEALAREARKALGTGSRVTEGVLTIQGDIPDRVEAWLLKRGAKRIVR